MDVHAAALVERARYSAPVCHSFCGGAQKRHQLDIWSGGPALVGVAADGGGEVVSDKQENAFVHIMPSPTALVNDWVEVLPGFFVAMAISACQWLCFVTSLSSSLAPTS